MKVRSKSHIIESVPEVKNGSYKTLSISFPMKLERLLVISTGANLVTNTVIMTAYWT